MMPVSLQRSAFVKQIRHDQLDVLHIQHPRLQAAIALQGAQLLRFQPHDDSNWFWLSEQAQYRQQQSVRGGIPICWPWFGALDKNHSAVRKQLNADAVAPAHGFVRQQPFILTRLHEACDHLELTLSWQGHYSGWQGNARLDVTFTLRASEFSITLTTHNLGSKPLAISQALHSYFPTRHIRHTHVHGLSQTTYIDTLRQWQRYDAQSIVSFHTETDRIYQTDGDDMPTLMLQTPEHGYALHSQNSRSLVLWNPWISKAQRLSQFAPHAWQHMVCLETGQVADDYRQLAAGEHSSLTLRITRRAV
ncbi:MAG: D-hexose-6-phosphate mutarotase [Bacterioplanes sp.]|nr:D-hexose-6-phosphate mutarotase [Bacterioplanes sp.]